MFGDLNHLAYEVGGCVRDLYLKLESYDVDYVIENTTKEQFEAVLPDAKLVGKDFPVYLVNNCEVALAREEFMREEKSDNAYTNFDVKVGVPLLHDLLRRDFTINSIAIKYDTREVIDPYNGRDDIANKILRAVNIRAFSEDPLRIYRGARFSVRFGLIINRDTFMMMKNNAHELKRISPDRVYAELKKVYTQCKKPSRFFYTLRDIGALKYHFKSLYVMDGIRAGSFEYHGYNTAFDHTMEAIDRCKANGYGFDIFLAVLFHDTGKGVTKKVAVDERQKHIGHEIMSLAINKKIVEQNRFSADENELILLFARQHMIFHILQNFKNYVRLVRWFRKVKRHWEKLLLCANCDHPLTLDQIEILLNLDKVFKETKVDVPKHLKGEGVVNFVEHTYAKAYAKLVKK